MLIQFRKMPTSYSGHNLDKVFGILSPEIPDISNKAFAELNATTWQEINVEVRIFWLAFQVRSSHWSRLAPTPGLVSISFFQNEI